MITNFFVDVADATYPHRNLSTPPVDISGYPHVDTRFGRQI
jgi:hypothetical protein